MTSVSQPGRRTLRLTLLGGLCALGLFAGASPGRFPNVHVLAGLAAMYLFGWGVTASELVTSRLASDLRRPVVNLGQSWYGPQQELEVLRRFGLPLHPRTCVWAFFEGNDLQDVERYEQALPVWPELSRRNHSFALRSFTRNALYALRRLGRTAGGQDATGTLAYPFGLLRQGDGREVRMYFEYPAHR